MTCRRGAVPMPPALSSGDRGSIDFSHLTGVTGVASAERDGGDRGRHNKKSFTFISVSSVLVSRFMAPDLVSGASRAQAANLDAVFRIGWRGGLQPGIYRRSAAGTG